MTRTRRCLLTAAAAEAAPVKAEPAADEKAAAPAKRTVNKKGLRPKPKAAANTVGAEASASLDTMEADKGRWYKTGMLYADLEEVSFLEKGQKPIDSLLYHLAKPSCHDTRQMYPVRLARRQGTNKNDKRADGGSEPFIGLGSVLS
ncbi:hypothetical protein [Sinorhizobium meliloti]|uniref:hypothetical protein n=1 Tax=Rhizobium meliloti TaxID=382 RepID=UPI0002D87CF8|nr:hypothetical protein [Sinorhizobium meliloti]